jgi:oxalate---CoA ligase
VGLVSERGVGGAGGVRSIAEIVHAWAKRSPDAVAVLGLDGSALTYAGLAAQVDLVELELRSLGIGAEDRVAVVLGDGPALATAFLGIASAAACAPLNPAYRGQELDFYLSDLGASAVVVARDARSTAARAAAERLGLLVIELEPMDDHAGSFTLRGNGRRPDAASETDRAEAALLLHTSGTTARPKLVPLTQANLCASATAVASSLALTPDDRCLTVMPLFHIHGLVASVLAPLAAGSTVVCSTGFDPTRFLSWLEAFRPSWFTAVPTMHIAIVERVRAGGGGAPNAGLRLVRSSSASLPAPVAEALEALLDCPVIEAYGMTEAAHQMASNPLPPRERKPGSVGLPAGPEIAVLDQFGNELASGEIGEVSVRGLGVFGGYERNTEANSSAFTGSWFRTGDQGYLDDDGYLFLRGRLKEIINRGGEKISPREVEEALLAHPSVADVVAFSQPHARLGEDVAAAIVLREDANGDGASIQRFAASRLAPFKVPATVVFLDELPKGATGKVQRVGMSDRLGLPALGAEDRAARPAYEAPRTALEQALCALWEELLDVERVGMHDDFIALGGDSLLLAQLLARIAESADEDVARTAEELPASSILWAPTVELFAALLERGWTETAGAVAVEPGRQGPPFFFFPAHDWGTVGLGALGRRLETEHALFTFELAADTRREDVASVASLATRFTHEIRATQPQGPYALGGICFGAAIALEVARELEAGGEQVTVVLVNPIGERAARVRGAVRWIVLCARNGTLVSWAHRRLTRRSQGEPSGRRAADLGLEQTLRAASRAYKARPYAGRISILAGADYTTPRRFWKRVALDGLDWRAVPHGSGAVFRTRHLDALAAELGDVLTQK